MPRLPVCLIAALVYAPVAHGQTIDQLRAQLRSELRRDQFASGLVTLIMLGNELELSGINYDLNDELDTEISALVLPFHTTFYPFENPKLGLYTEGVVGYSVMDQSGDDLFDDGVPELATRYDTEWTSIGGLGGLGLEVQLSRELAVAGICQLGVSYLENETTYEGPGAEFASLVLDDLLFNWDGWAATFGLAARLEWRRELGRGRRIEFTGRYDVRWTESIETEDIAQEFSAMSELTTARLEYSAPTGRGIGPYPIRWRTHMGLSWLLPTETSEPFGAFELGGGFDFMTNEALPWVDGLSAGGAVFLGGDATGWSVGVGVLF